MVSRLAGRAVTQRTERTAAAIDARFSFLSFGDNHLTNQVAEWTVEFRRAKQHAIHQCNILGRYNCPERISSNHMHVEQTVVAIFNILRY